MHIHFLANALQDRGHRCYVILPVEGSEPDYFGTPRYTFLSVNEAAALLRRNSPLLQDSIFHAWTPREVPRRLTQGLARIAGRPYFVHLEDNEEYIRIIEKKAENLYRTINQKLPCLPASNQAVKQKVAITKNINFTPQESEQLSQFVSDDTYVQRQKADIQELASMFRDLMGSSERDDPEEFLRDIQGHFKPQPGVAAGYKLTIEGKKQPLIIEINGSNLQCYYGEGNRVDVEVQLSRTTMENIIAGKSTFQASFMAGDMRMKGDFKILRALDQVLLFGVQPAGAK